MFALFSFPIFDSGRSRRSYSVVDFAGHEKVRIEIRLKVGYVLLVDQTKTTRLSVQTSTSIITESIAKGIEEFSPRYEIALNWICDGVCRK